MEKIVWSEQEYLQVAREIIRQYPRREYLSNAKSIETFVLARGEALEAQRVLPKNRQRDFNTVAKVKPGLLKAFASLRRATPEARKPGREAGQQVVRWDASEWRLLAIALRQRYPTMTADTVTTTAINAVQVATPGVRPRPPLASLHQSRLMLGRAFQLLDADESPAPLVERAPQAESGGDEPKFVVWMAHDYDLMVAALYKLNKQYLHSETLAGLKPSEVRAVQHVLEPGRRRTGQGAIPTLTPMREKFLAAFARLRVRLTEEAEQKRLEREQRDEEKRAEEAARAEQEALEARLREEQERVLAMETQLRAQAPENGSLEQLVEVFAARLAGTFANAFVKSLTNQISEGVRQVLPTMMATTLANVEPMSLPRKPHVIAVDRGPKVLIVGPHSDQEHELVKAYPHLRLTVVTTDANNIRDKVKFADKVIGMTKFMNHPMDGILSSTAKERYCRIDGGMSAIRHQIDVWMASGVLPKPQEAA